MNRQFNNYGGEDRFWLGPEGGQFGLWFDRDADQVLDNWFTPAALNEGAMHVVAAEGGQQVHLERALELTNASGTPFQLSLQRLIRLAGRDEFADTFGAEAAQLLDHDDVDLVGFASENYLTNRGETLDPRQGLVSIWILGMFQPGQRAVVVVPYKSGAEAQLGPVVNADYFGPVPKERLQVTPDAILFRADGNYRSKIGVTPARARAVCGAVDLEAGVLTLVHFNLPGDAAEQPYVNNTWVVPQEKPLAGDAVNSYNDGPPEPGAESLGGFFELETLSPAAPLDRGESLTHVHTTYHVQASPQRLAALLRATLGVDVTAVERFLERAQTARR